MQLKTLIPIGVLGLLTTLSFQACGSDSVLQAEIAGLKLKIQQDSLLRSDMERGMAEVDASMGQIADFNQEMASGKMSKADFETKVSDIDGLLERNKQKIKVLQERIEETRSNLSLGHIQQYSQSLQERQASLELYQQDLDQLKQATAKLTAENDRLKLDQSALQISLNSKDKELGDVRRQIEEAKRELQTLQNKISQTESKAKTLEEQALQQYVKIAQELIEIARDAKGLFGSANATKEECTIKAFDYLCMAHQMGHYNALSYLQQLRADTKLNKYLKAKDCG